MTILEQWQLTKLACFDEARRVVECVMEASSIIEEKCGQKIQPYFYLVQDEGKQLSIVGENIAFNWKDGVYDRMGSFPELDPQAHWEMSLSCAKSIRDTLKDINTGAVIARWEKLQS